MRLWSLHPCHLDRVGLVAGWREALLAQAVLAGHTRGYKHHPQLQRFTEGGLDAIGAFLVPLATEASVRGYRFNTSKILVPSAAYRTTVTQGQMAHELGHLRAKLEARAPQELHRLEEALRPHPMFEVIPGGPESWERHFSDSSVI